MDFVGPLCVRRRLGEAFENSQTMKTISPSRIGRPEERRASLCNSRARGTESLSHRLNAASPAWRSGAREITFAATRSGDRARARARARRAPARSATTPARPAGLLCRARRRIGRIADGNDLDRAQTNTTAFMRAPAPPPAAAAAAASETNPGPMDLGACCARRVAAVSSSPTRFNSPRICCPSTSSTATWPASLDN